MGLLSQGSPLSWEETKRHADHVRRHGILQFLHIYHAVKDRHKDVLKWGDEVIFNLVYLQTGNYQDPPYRFKICFCGQYERG
uniref:Glutamate--cysteine ligase n=2 Tax=Platyrrhini TaxID=9479 RepID=A0A2K5EZE9_AOTNA